jgi:hypothetical protein
VTTPSTLGRNDSVTMAIRIPCRSFWLHLKNNSGVE